MLIWGKTILTGDDKVPPQGSSRVLLPRGSPTTLPEYSAPCPGHRLLAVLPSNELCTTHALSWVWGGGCFLLFMFSAFLSGYSVMWNINFILIKESSMSPCPSPSKTATEDGLWQLQYSCLPSMTRHCSLLTAHFASSVRRCFELSRRCFEMKIFRSFCSKVMCFLCRRSTVLGSPQCRPPLQRSSPITRS